MRPYWTGNIRLSLVSIAVEIFPAVDNYTTIPLHEIYRKTGERVHHQNVAGSKIIERKDIIKGFEYKKGQYVELEPDEVKNLKIPSSDVLEIIQFVDSSEIDSLYFERPYFVVPKNDAAEKAFAIIREALRKTAKLGLGQLAIGGRERLCALKPYGRGMMIEVIRYEEEIRRADLYFSEIDDVKIDKDELQLATQLIKQKTLKFNPSKFHDHYNEALQELINSKLHKTKPRKVQEKKPERKVVNLLDALKKSLEEKTPKTASVRIERKKKRA